ncbi:MFS transporter [Candidatus Nitrosotalea bavarica]|uniref:MFS transporter n=1 Tax=Candidatus Nitrosotalea bavarica TaxID=1903277 RepID=UPI000C70552A|nr:MFS transporter [Candidatus Nitrosotalea bavarica]
MNLSSHQRSVLLGSFLGWALDGYDLVLMLLVIPLISKLFFPTGNATLSLLAAFAAYVVTLIMRPVGGAFFGNFGDKIGRKKAMMITIIGFSVATFSTGLLPTWEMVGILAPIFLVTLRFLQGFFAGGEWGSGAVITMETVPKSSRGLLSGILQSGYNFGFILASVVYYFVFTHFSGPQFTEIGWRIMFFTGIIPGLTTLFVRIKMKESQVWLEKFHQKKIERAPLRKIFSDVNIRKRFFLALIIMTGLQYGYYTTMGFYPTFLQNYVNMDKSEIPFLLIVATITSFFGQIFAGYISQKIGRMKTLGLFAISAIILAIPAVYGLYHAVSFYERSLYTVILIFTATSGFGPIPAFLSERFPTQVRNTANGFVYNGGLLIGSWAPLIAVSLLSHGGSFIPVLLGINVIVASIILLFGSKMNPETRDTEIN